MLWLVLNLSQTGIILVECACEWRSSVCGGSREHRSKKVIILSAWEFRICYIYVSWPQVIYGKENVNHSSSAHTLTAQPSQFVALNLLECMYKHTNTHNPSIVPCGTHNADGFSIKQCWLSSPHIFVQSICLCILVQRVSLASASPCQGNRVLWLFAHSPEPTARQINHSIGIVNTPIGTLQVAPSATPSIYIQSLDVASKDYI